MPSPKRGPAPESAIGSLIGDGIEALQDGLAFLRAEIGLITSGKAKKTRHDPAYRVAFLLGKVTGLVDGLRKIEAARARPLASLTPAVVLAYLRTLDPEERANVIREASLIDARKSGLG